MNLESLITHPVYKNASALIIRYRAVLVFTIAAFSIGAAAMQASDYLSPQRNETLFTEEVLRIDIESIDEQKLSELQQTQTDQSIPVDTDFAPGRSNPFSE